jgi:mediator of RNA polymerase II transcription subunit 13
VLVQSAVQQKKVCVFGGFQAADEYLKSLGWQGEIFAKVWI